MTKPYFADFESREPPHFAPMSATRERLWHFLAGCSAIAAIVYLNWRWRESLNPDAIVFSILVASAETLLIFGMLLFYFDIWKEGDTPIQTAPRRRSEAGLAPATGPICVDIFVTTYNEDPEVVGPTLAAANAIVIPDNVRTKLFLLDDGDRSEMVRLASVHNATYLARNDNVGFKAGNLRNGLFHSAGDFVVICDADTRLKPTFITNTMGYFRDAQVAWVQTPHWFYDIPDGQPPSHFFTRPSGRMTRLIQMLPNQWRIGRDPFLCDPSVFFDIIQRRRNRNQSSFCCGAASIHRREAVFSNAIERKVTATKAHSDLHNCPNFPSLAGMQPFCFHVSEDLYTSMLMHEDQGAGWKSVYHPQVEAKMLSPWSARAWAVQRLKYAGGTFDLMMHDNPVFRSQMTLKTKLHYLATFWSYLTVLWLPIVLLAPAISLLFAVSPVQAPATTFFIHFLPMIIFAELALSVSLKGHNVQVGRLTALATMSIQFKAFLQSILGKTAHFPPTPKSPMLGESWRYVRLPIALSLVLAVAIATALMKAALGYESLSLPLLIVNCFWASYNLLLLLTSLRVAVWKPSDSVVGPLAKNA